MLFKEMVNAYGQPTPRILVIADSTMVALYAVWYNWVRIHKTLRVTPAMAAGLTDRLMSMEDVVAMIEAREVPKMRGP